jgi:hypothetical protein
MTRGGFDDSITKQIALVKRAEDGRWSSVRAHLSRRDDGVVATAPIRERSGGDFATLIVREPAPALLAAATAARSARCPSSIASRRSRDAIPGRRSEDRSEAGRQGVE